MTYQWSRATQAERERPAKTIRHVQDRDSMLRGYRRPSLPVSRWHSFDCDLALWAKVASYTWLWQSQSTRRSLHLCSSMRSVSCFCSNFKTRMAPVGSITCQKSRPSTVSTTSSSSVSASRNLLIACEREGNKQKETGLQGRECGREYKQAK